MPALQKIKIYYDPLGRVVKTVNPDNSEQRTVYGVPQALNVPGNYIPTPWENYAYDPNDLASLTNTSSSNVPGSHYFTPKSSEIDALGRTVKTIEFFDNSDYTNTIAMQYNYDVRGNLLLVKDAYLRNVFEHVYDLRPPQKGDNDKEQPLPPLRTEHIDKGTNTILFDARSKAIESYDAKGAHVLSAYDVISRAVFIWANDKGIETQTLRQCLTYGDALPGTPEVDNLKGKLYQNYDEAGLIEISEYDFKGNTLEKTRQVISDAELLSVFGGTSVSCYRVDWTGAPDTPPPILDSVVYESSMEYDALNRIRKIKYPEDQDAERKELIPTYNTAGALESVDFDGYTYVSNIAYNAKGQRILVAYGNGIMMRYVYNSLTFRLSRQRSESFTKSGWIYTGAGNVKKDTAYQYDLIGNIINTYDNTTHCGIANANYLDRDFYYDAIYRLLSGNGRENAPTISPVWDDSFRSDDNSTTTGYTQNYEYDKMGNITKLQHVGAGNFTRNFNYTPTNNKLNSVDVGASNYTFTYDACGNQLTETSSRKWEWDYSNRARCFFVEAGTSITQYTEYLYDGAGNRLKKLTWKTGGTYDSITYIDGVFEYRSNGIDEQNILHVMDIKSRIALIRIGNNFGDTTPAIKYNIEDHLISSLILLDSGGSDVNFEEYYPFGETSFGSYALKCYKYCGKERDKESGLYFYGARYYSAWTCRFISVDPKAKEYLNLSVYVYAGNNPIMLTDIFGEGPGPSEKRLILYSTNNHDKTHTESFKKAAWKLKNEYNSNSGVYGDAKASASSITHGSEIVKYINQQENDSIKSLDIYSHGSRQGIWFADTEGVQENSKRGNLYRTKNYQYKENSTTNSKSKNVEDINYSKFTNDARIEIHGCETGGSAVEKGNENIGRTMSSLLHSAGKTGAVVIANYGQSGPDSSGDYRQEGNIRIVYWNGEELFRTTKGGNISDTEIKQAIEKKTQESNGNKTQQKTPKSVDTYQTTPTTK